MNFFLFSRLLPASTVPLLLVLGLMLQSCTQASSRCNSFRDGGLPWLNKTGCIQVPLDYEHPEGQQITIYYTRSVPKGACLGRLLAFHGGPGFPRSDLPGRGLLWEGLRAFFDVVYIHQRGSGFSERFSMKELMIGARYKQFGLEEIVLDAWLVHSSIWGDEPAVILGKSAGGFLAMMYALRFPAQVSRLILAATSSHGGYSRERNRIKDEFDEQLRARFPDLSTLDRIMEKLQGMELSRGRALGREELEQRIFFDLYYTVAGQNEVVAIRRELEQNRPELLNQRLSRGVTILKEDELTSREVYYIIACRELGWASQNPGLCMFFGQGRDYDLRGRLGEIQVPVLVIGGLQDPILPLKYQQEIAEELGERAELHVFEHSGHMVFVEEPRHAASIIFRFLGIPGQQPAQKRSL